MAERKALKGFESPGTGRVAEGETFDDTGLTEEDDRWLVSKGAIEPVKQERTTPRRRIRRRPASG